MIEIRFTGDTEIGPPTPVEVVPPCKRMRISPDGSLYRDVNGNPEVIEVITERPRVYESYTAIDIQSDKPKIPCSTPKPLKGLAKPCEVPKPPRSPLNREAAALKPRPSRGNGRSKAWNQTPGLTLESVMQGVLAGASITEIARKHGCKYNTVNVYLIDARRSSEEFRMAYDAARKCICGASKLTHQPACLICRRKTVKCSEEECENLAKCAGMCNKHYMRRYRGYVAPQTQ